MQKHEFLKSYNVVGSNIALLSFMKDRKPSVK